jgi:hypothetical protein
MASKAWSGVIATQTATQVRVPRLKLDCLNPNPQAPEKGPPEKRLITGCGWYAKNGVSRSSQGQTNRQPQDSEFKGMSREPTGR